MGCGVQELWLVGDYSQVIMAELAWLPCLANSIRSLCIRISDRPGDSPTCRSDDVLNNEAGLSTQGGQYQKSELYLQTLACFLHDRGQKPLLPYLTFGTAQMRSRTVRSRVEQLSHLQGIAATCQPRVIQAGPAGLTGPTVQKPWETDVPCLSSLSYPQHSFSQELTET